MQNLPKKIRHMVYMHLVWKRRFEVGVKNRAGMVRTAARSKPLDPFTIWLRNVERVVPDASRPYLDTVQDRHSRCRGLAAQISNLAETGERVQAMRLLEGEFRIASMQLIAALHAWDKMVERQQAQDVALLPAFANVSLGSFHSDSVSPSLLRFLRNMLAKTIQRID